MPPLADWLSSHGREGDTNPPVRTPQQGAAGLLVAAAHREGRYSLVEEEAVTASLMKLFMIGNPEASALRQEAEALVEESVSFLPFADAAKKLPEDDQAALLRQLWTVLTLGGEVSGENPLFSRVRDILGFSPAEADALKPVKE
jgi:uncharacterized tellurite resistance protein B-like protein